MILTKEWLQQTIAAMESQRDEAPFGISDDHDMTIEALKMALAGMETTHNSVIAEQLDHVLSGMDVTAHQRAVISCAVDRLNKNAELLQQAPPPLTTSERAELDNYRSAQQVVPDERVAFESFMEKRLGDVVDRSRALNGDNEYMAWDMAVSWIAWQGRAAMLQGAVKDGWVACSERMPLTAHESCLYEDIEVQVFDGKNVFIAHYSIGSLPELWGAWMDTYADITHWQPLAAAPQQESE